MANLTPEQFEKALNNAKQALQANMGKILVNASSIGSAEMQRRVFNRGLTTAGKRMEYRNAPSNYTNLRQDAGLQISYKDLTFTGNLFYSMNILSTAEKEVTYGFNNSDTAQIAEWQQTSPKQVNEPIFELSDKEIAKMERQMSLDALAIIQGAIDGFPNVPNITPKDATQKAIKRNKQKKLKLKQVKQRSSITEKFEQQKNIKAKKSESIAKKQEGIKKAQERVSKAKTSEARQKAQESLNKKKQSLAKAKQSALETRTRLRKTRAKYKRITGKKK